MITKSYTKNGINYGYSVKAKKWAFEVPALRHTALLSLATARDKAATAEKIANVLAGAVKRGGVDNLARKNIQTILARAE